MVITSYSDGQNVVFLMFRLTYFMVRMSYFNGQNVAYMLMIRMSYLNGQNVVF